jgi:hypothetical protein
LRGFIFFYQTKVLQRTAGLGVSSLPGHTCVGITVETRNLELACAPHSTCLASVEKVFSFAARVHLVLRVRVILTVERSGGSSLYRHGQRVSSRRRPPHATMT